MPVEELKSLVSSNEREIERLEREAADGVKAPAMAPDAYRREHVLLMRLAEREREVQTLLPQLKDLKQLQMCDATRFDRSAYLNPLLNTVYKRLATGAEKASLALDMATADAEAWQFDPDSESGARLLARTQAALQHNQQLGTKLAPEQLAGLESELALKQKYKEQLETAIKELKKLAEHLDDDMLALYAKLMHLQGLKAKAPKATPTAAETTASTTALETKAAPDTGAACQDTRDAAAAAPPLSQALGC
eukprot:m.142774 g.142774  ORF g.142774 m.142774 type:complete len:250 (+) comp17146_c2_seq2:601-1350(+)